MPAWHRDGMDGMAVVRVHVQSARVLDAPGHASTLARSLRVRHTLLSAADTSMSSHTTQNRRESRRDRTDVADRQTNLGTAPTDQALPGDQHDARKTMPSMPSTVARCFSMPTLHLSVPRCPSRSL